MYSNTGLLPFLSRLLLLILHGKTRVMQRFTSFLYITRITTLYTAHGFLSSSARYTMLSLRRTSMVTGQTSNVLSATSPRALPRVHRNRRPKTPGVQPRPPMAVGPVPTRNQERERRLLATYGDSEATLNHVHLYYPVPELERTWRLGIRVAPPISMAVDWPRGVTRLRTREGGHEDNDIENYRTPFHPSSCLPGHPVIVISLPLRDA
ncbi:hypothetical protein WG66_008310 [Moniliophthora roreri]|nr:hypothetical protein WG66_008310 [Moniliophthora roreri]